MAAAVASGAAIPRSSVMPTLRPRESYSNPRRSAASPNDPLPYTCCWSTRLSPPFVSMTFASAPMCSSKAELAWKRSAGKTEYSLVSVMCSSFSGTSGVSFPKP